MEPVKCNKCGQDLSTLRWSGGKNILVCINGNCQAYRNPVSTLPGILLGENQTAKRPLMEKEGFEALLPRYRILTDPHFNALTHRNA